MSMQMARPPQSNPQLQLPSYTAVPRTPSTFNPHCCDHRFLSTWYSSAGLSKTCTGGVGVCPALLDPSFEAVLIALEAPKARRPAWVIGSKHQKNAGKEGVLWDGTWAATTSKACIPDALA